MIKVEKHGIVTRSEITGDTYTLISEFRCVLQSMHRMLEASIKETVKETPEDLLHEMVKDVAEKERAKA